MQYKPIKYNLLAILLATTISAPGYSQRTSFTVIPPGMVTQQTRIELRLAVWNDSTAAGAFEIEFAFDQIDETHRIHHERVNIPAGECRLIRAWWQPGECVGSHELLGRIQFPDSKIKIHKWPVTVYSSETPALPLLLGGWCDPGALVEGWGYSRTRPVTEQDIRDEMDAMRRIGMSTLIITYVEYGMAFYPSQVLTGPYYGKDVVEIMLSQADQNGMHAFLGLGRGDDIYLLWNGLNDLARLQVGVDFSARVARELWQMYQHHPSFYGWYLTHEMDDLAKASRYYDAVADSCHAFSPDKPVLVAPAGTPQITRELLRKSHVNIFAYQDAVGTGFKNYSYTYDPEIRIADLDSVYRRYAAWHPGTDKHIWSDLELWRAAKETGYSNFKPAPFDQVQRQMAIESNYVEMLTGYEFLSQMEFPESTLLLGGEQAVQLYQDYADYVAQFWENALVAGSGQNPIPDSPILLRNFPNPFNATTRIQLELPETGFISLEIYNLLGQSVRALFAGNLPAGRHQFLWDSRDEAGLALASGVYFLHGQCGRNDICSKLLLVR